VAKASYVLALGMQPLVDIVEKASNARSMRPIERHAEMSAW